MDEIEAGAAVCAWGDESMRFTKVSEPMYLLGVALADDVTAERAREAMHSIRPVGSFIGGI